MYIGTGQELLVSKVEKIGKIITLYDQSILKVDPMDIAKSIMLMMTEAVVSELIAQ